MLEREKTNCREPVTPDGSRNIINNARGFYDLLLQYFRDKETKFCNFSKLDSVLQEVQMVGYFYQAISGHSICSKTIEALNSIGESEFNAACDRLLSGEIDNFDFNVQFSTMNAVTIWKLNHKK